MAKLTQIIVVDSDGEILTAADGQVGGSSGRVFMVKRNNLLGTPIRLTEPYGEPVRSELNIRNPIGIVAALFSAKPGRSKLLEAPPEVWDWIDSDIEKYGEPSSEIKAE